VNKKSCPCGTGISYPDCCGGFISGKSLPGTAEQLMRSRYTAYFNENIAYIIKTMKSPAADNFDLQTAQERARKTLWTRLEVLQAANNDTKGTVEFRAYYTAAGQQCVMHEVSEFIREDGKWYYVSGQHQGEPIAPFEKEG
jgi:SEC-C motif-containing protein